MQNVTLKKTDTCLTYVIKRLGYKHEVDDFRSMEHYFDYFIFKEHRDTLSLGDILLWDKNMRWEWIPWQINNNHGIVCKHVPINFHFAIYEGDDYISDLTRKTGTPPHYPYLRLRNINDLKRLPDRILRPKYNI